MSSQLCVSLLKPVSLQQRQSFLCDPVELWTTHFQNQNFSKFRAPRCISHPVVLRKPLIMRSAENSLWFQFRGKFCFCYESCFGQYFVCRRSPRSSFQRTATARPKQQWMRVYSVWLPQVIQPATIFIHSDKTNSLHTARSLRSSEKLILLWVIKQEIRWEWEELQKSLSDAQKLLCGWKFSFDCVKLPGGFT